MIWMNVIVWAGFLCVNTSMAEMGSMAPVRNLHKLYVVYILTSYTNI
jgi:hypothetical protein